MLGVFAIWLSAFSIVVAVVLTAVILFHLIWSIRKESRFSATIKYLNGEWKVTLYDKDEIQAYNIRPVSESFIHPWLLVAVFKGSDVDSKKRQIFVVFPDSTDKDAFRRLRVALRFRK